MVDEQANRAPEVARPALVPHVAAKHVELGQWYARQQQVAHVLVVRYVHYGVRNRQFRAGRDQVVPRRVLDAVLPWIRVPHGYVQCAQDLGRARGQGVQGPVRQRWVVQAQMSQGVHPTQQPQVPFEYTFIAKNSAITNEEVEKLPGVVVRVLPLSEGAPQVERGQPIPADLGHYGQQLENVGQAEVGIQHAKLDQVLLTPARLQQSTIARFFEN